MPTPHPHSSTSEATSSITPREGSVDGWGKYGLRSSLLAFKTKWRKKGQKQVSPRQRLGDCSQPTFAQNGQKNYYSAHSLCHSVVVGCHSFAPFGGVSLLHPLPPGVARGWHINAPSGRKPDKRTGYHLLYLTEGQKDMILPPFISDRRTKGHDTPSLHI